MKILIVSNMYPPLYQGGYEVRCRQVAEALQQRGCEVRVLTSVFGLPMKALGAFPQLTEVIDGVRVDRWLYNSAFGPQPWHRPWTLFQAKRELADARGLCKVLEDFRPHVVNWWNMNGLSKLLLPIPESRDIPSVHWIEDSWMINDYGPNGEKAAKFWAGVWDGGWGPLPCRPLLRWIGKRWEERVAREGLPTRNFLNQPALVSFVSEYLRTMYHKSGLKWPSSDVQFGGIPATRFFSPIDEKKYVRGKIRMLYAGQITSDRGLHTVIESLGQMSPPLRESVSLTVVGEATGVYRPYYQRIVDRVEELRLSNRVTLVGKIGHDQMAQVYKEHDLLVFPSTRGEGLPLVMAEAMVAGCAVITTGSGGAQEIADLARLPIFPKEDSFALARLLENLLEHPERLQELAMNGQTVALRELTLEKMIEQWEHTLLKVSRLSPTFRKVALEPAG